MQLEPLVGEGRLASIVGLRSRSATSSSPVLAARSRSRRMRSIARLRAVVTSQAPRVVGRALARPALGGDRERLLRGLLGEIEVAEEADQGGEDATPLLAEDLLDRMRSTALHHRADLDRAAQARSRDPLGDLERRVDVVDVEHVEAAEHLLGLGERPVGGQRLAVALAQGGGHLRRVQLTAVDVPGRVAQRDVLGIDLARSSSGRSWAPGSEYTSIAYFMCLLVELACQGDERHRRGDSATARRLSSARSGQSPKVA